MAGGEGERERGREDSLCAMKSVRKICKTFYKCWSSLRVQLCTHTDAGRGTYKHTYWHTHRRTHLLVCAYGCGQSNKVDMHNLG